MTNGNEILAAVLSLHEATEGGFSRVDVRLDALETRVGSLETRVGGMETRVGAMETHLTRFEFKVLERFDAVDARLIALEPG